MDDKLESLYKTLVADGYELPDLETFRKDMSDPSRLAKLHANLSQNGYELPASVEQFRADLFGAPVQEQNTWAKPSQYLKELASNESGNPLVNNPIVKYEAAASRGVYDLGRSAISFVADQLPQQAIQAGNTLVAEMHPTTASAYVKEHDPAHYQRFVREKLDIPWHTSFDQGYYDNEELAQEYLNSTPKGAGILKNIQAKAPENIAKRVENEQRVQAQKEEAAYKLGGANQDIFESKDLSDVMSAGGTLGGQVLGQIPLSIMTGGLTSYMMESASVSDNQLDRIAKLHGISREEAIKRGYDRPTEGQMYGMIAGALDAMSAGEASKVKKLLAAGDKGVLKKLLTSPAAKSAYEESLTEPTQGVLEEVGGAQGTPTTNTEALSEALLTKEGLKRRANEAIGGFLGAGVGHVATNPKAIFGGKESDVADLGINEADYDVQVPNAQVNNTLDEQAKLEAAELNRMMKDLGIDLTEEAPKEFKKEEAKVEKVVNEVLPEAKAEAAVPKMEIQSIVGKPTEVPVTETPVEPVTEPVIPQPVTEEPAAQRSTTIPGVKPIYRTSQNEMTNASKYGAPERGGIMHAWTDEKSDKSVGIFTVEPSLHGDVVPSDRTDLLVPKGRVEKAHPAFKAKDFGNVTTQIDLTREPKLLKTKDTGMDLHTDAIIEAAQKSKDVNQDALDLFLKKTENMPDDKRQSALSAFLRTRAGGEFDGIVYKNKAETTKKIKAVNKVAAEPTEEDNITYIEKANNAVKKYRPSQKIDALERMLNKAESKGLTKAVSHIQKLIEKVDKEEQAKIAEKEEKTELKEKKEQKPPKEEKKTPELIKYKGVSKTLAAWKKEFYKEIGAAETEHIRKIRVAKYNEFRKESGLGFKNKEYVPLTEARVAQIVASELGTKGGKKFNEAKKREATRENERIFKEAEKAGLSVAEYKELQRAAKEDIGEAFGLDPNDIEDVSAMSISKLVEGKLIEEGLYRYPRKEITFDEFKNLAPSSQNRILNGLFKVISRYKGKEDSGTKFIQISVPHGVQPKTLGFQFSTSKSDNSYVAVVVDEKTGRPIAEDFGLNAPLHEYLHDYTKMMFHRVYKSNKNFSDSINKAFDNVKKAAHKAAESLFYKQIVGDQNFDENDINLAVINNMKFLDNKGVVSKDVKSASKEFYRLLETNKKLALEYARDRAKTLANDLYSEFYAFENVLEFMAEAFSDPHTMMFLSKIKMDETISKGINKGQRKSLLYKWYEELSAAVKKLFSVHGLSDVDGNALEYLADTIGIFDEEFITGDLPRLGDWSVFPDMTPGEVRRGEANLDINFKKIASKAKAFRKIISNITSTLEPRKEIKTLDDVKDYLKRVNAHLEKKLDVDLYGPKVLTKIKRIRSQREKAQLMQAKLVSNAKKLPIYQTSWKFKDDISDWERVRIEDLKVKSGNNEVREYLHGLGMMSLNGVPSQRAYNIMINYGKKLQILQEILPIAKNVNQSFIGSLSHWSNPATFSSIVSKYNAKIGNSLMKGIYGGSMRTMSRSQIESAHFYQELTDLAEKNNFTHSDLAKVGMYGAIMSTVSKPGTKEWVTEVGYNAKAAVAAANSKMEAFKTKNYKGSLSKKAIENEQRIAEEIQSKIIGNGTLSKILNDKQYDFYNKIKGFAAKHEADFERNSVGNWGNEDFQKRWNYFPTLAQGSVDKGGDVKSDALLRGNADNLFEALSDEGKKGYGYVFGKKVWSNYRRMNPKGYFYENDALAIAQKWGKSMLYDLYASKELKAINRVLEDGKFKQEYNTNIRSAFQKHLKSISGAANKYDPNVGAVVKFLLKSRDKLYTAALATSGQILLQSSSGFVAAAVMSMHLNPKTSLQSFSKAVQAAAGSLKHTSKFQRFLEENGLGIQVRDILFEKYLSAEDYRAFQALRKVKGISNKIENVSEWSLRAGDKLGARLVWFAAYFNAGGTFENPSKEAVLAAERMTGIMQNMSDMSFSAPAFRYNSHANKILMSTLFAFKSFSINAALNIWYSARYSPKSPEARQVLTGQLGSILAYHTLAVMLGKLVYKPLTGAVAKAFGADDDDDDKEEPGVLEKILTTSIWDLMVGMWAPSAVDELLKWFYNETGAKVVANKLHGTDYDEFDKYADSPISSMKDPTDVYKAVLGPGFKEEAELAVDLMSLTAEQMMADEYAEEVQKADTRNAKWNEFLIRTMGTAIGATYGFPLRGDFKRILNGVAAKKRAQRGKQGRASSTGTTNAEYQIQ